MSTRVLDAIIKLNPATTDADGVFRLTGIPANTEVYSNVEKEHCALDPEHYRAEFVDTHNLVIVPAGSVAGRLVDEKGRPVPGVKILFSSEHWRLSMSREENTTEEGTFVANALVPGTYSVSITQNADVTMPVLTGVIVKARQTADAGDLTVTPGAFLCGRVLDADSGEPVTSGRIHASGPMTPGSRGQFRAPVDEQGRYRLRVCPGEIQIYYGDSGSPYSFDHPSETVQVTDAGLDGVDLKVRKADAARGRVVDPDGKPVAGAKVSVSGNYAPAATDKNGQFTVYVSPDRRPEGYQDYGKVVLAVVDETNKQGAFERVAREDLLKSELLIELKPARTLTLTVKDQDGKPLEGVEARLTSRYISLSRRAVPVISDEKGEAVFDVYENGSYYPQAVCDGYYYDNSRIRESPKVGTKEWTGTAEITMIRATRVQTGKVVDEEGNPIKGATVNVQEVLQKHVQTDEKGEFRLENLPDSSVGLFVMAGETYARAQVDKDTGPVTITLKRRP